MFCDLMSIRFLCGLRILHQLEPDNVEWGRITAGLFDIHMTPAVHRHWPVFSRMRPCSYAQESFPNATFLLQKLG